MNCKSLSVIADKHTIIIVFRRKSNLNNQTLKLRLPAPYFCNVASNLACYRTAVFKQERDLFGRSLTASRQERNNSRLTTFSRTRINRTLIMTKIIFYHTMPSYFCMCILYEKIICSYTIVPVHGKRNRRYCAYPLLHGQDRGSKSLAQG